MSGHTRWAWTLALVAAGLALAAASVGFVLRSTAGYPTGLGVASLAAFAVYAWLDRARLAEALASRAFVYGSGSWLMVAMVGAIGAGGFTLARRHDHTWDWTREQTYSLSEHTGAVLDGMQEEVQVLAFFRGDSEAERTFANRIRLFQERTPRLVVTFVDPLANPRLAKEHDIASDAGTVLLIRGERERRLTAFDETSLTDALVVLLSDEEHRICWSTGHGEPDPDDEFTEGGHGGFVARLEGANYQVTRQDIARAGVDRACHALVVAAPTAPLLPYELEAIAAYVAEGGRLLVLLEPFESEALTDGLVRYGVAVGDDLVVDLNRENQLLGVQDPSVVVLSGALLGRHEITQDLSAAVVLPSARSVALVDPLPTGLTGQVVLQTGAQAWGETSPELAAPSPDPGAERVGDVPVMVAVQVDDPAVLAVGAPAPVAPADASVPPPTADLAALQADAARGVPEGFTPRPGGRVVVLGDQQLLDNATLGLGNNQDLGLNAIAWLVGEEAQIGERPQTADKLTVTALGEGLMCLVSVVFVPGTAAALALVALLRRRFL